MVSASEAVIYDVAAGNRAMARVLESTDRLLGYLTINPRRLDDAERDVRELLPTGRFVGVKIHTDYTASPARRSTQPSSAPLAVVLDGFDWPLSGTLSAYLPTQHPRSQPSPRRSATLPARRGAMGDVSGL